MIRHWQVPPDQQMETPDGPVGVVSQQALMNAVMDGVVMVDRAGGYLAVVVTRHPTGAPGEMVTSNAVVTWQDRISDAKAQPESTQDVIPDRAEVVPADTSDFSTSYEEPVVGRDGAVRHAEEAVALDEDELAEVDESAVPAEFRD